MWNISIWAVIFQDELWYLRWSLFTRKILDFGIDGSYFGCHQRYMLFQNAHCYWHYIWIPRVFSWRDIYYLITSSMLWFFHFQCWWWWECEIFMVKDFTTSPHIGLLRAEGWLESRMGIQFGIFWNGWDLLSSWNTNLQAEPGLRFVMKFSLLKKEQHLVWWSHLWLISFSSGGDWSPERTVLSKS